MDFVNFVHRAESKLVSKRKSLNRYLDGAEFHVGHHYDPTRGPYKHAFIEIDASVFGGSSVKIAVKLESDDKPNSSGSVVDLIRLAKGALDRDVAGYVPEACAFSASAAATTISWRSMPFAPIGASKHQCRICCWMHSGPQNCPLS